MGGQKVNSFVLRRRDAVVSRAVRKKITDLQRVLNFRKIRIFDRFLYLSNVEIWAKKAFSRRFNRSKVKILVKKGQKRRFSKVKIWAKKGQKFGLN